MISNIPAPGPKFDFTGRSIVLKLIDRAAELTQEPSAAIRSAQRQRELFLIRAGIVYVARERGRSFPQIGRALNRDHTSAIHAYRRAKAMLSHDAQFSAFVRALESVH